MQALDRGSGPVLDLTNLPATHRPRSTGYRWANPGETVFAVVSVQRLPTPKEGPAPAFDPLSILDANPWAAQAAKGPYSAIDPALDSVGRPNQFIARMTHDGGQDRPEIELLYGWDEAGAQWSRTAIPPRQEAKP